MKLNYILGDLLESDERIIAHGCNAQGVMGSGIAKAIRDRYPYCYKYYADYHAAIPLELGQTLMHYEGPLQDDGIPLLVIGNCITQNLFGRTGDCFVSYEAIEKSLEYVFAWAANQEIKSVGLPLIGAGLGGGDWNKISAIIQELAEIFEVEANIYLIDQALYEKYAT